jgi:hypothetical protein
MKRKCSSFIMVKGGQDCSWVQVISEFWSLWRKTNQVSSKKVKNTVLDDGWWEKVDLTIKIMDPIISLLRFADTDHPILGEVYEGWDSMIKFVKSIILQHECLEYGTSIEDLIHHHTRYSYQQVGCELSTFALLGSLNESQIL